MEQKFETRCEKKPLFCLKFSPRNLYFTKNSLYEKPLFLKEPARGPVSVFFCPLTAHIVLGQSLILFFTVPTI